MTVTADRLARIGDALEQAAAADVARRPWRAHPRLAVAAVALATSCPPAPTQESG